LRANIESRSFTFQEVALIGYITLGTNDLERARTFYDALLSEMGVKRLMEFGDRG
jgi:catechol 2,3-dioxygenase-like lactoylglutathione lyase family enzyme